MKPYAVNRLDALRKLRDEGYAVVDREGYESLRARGDTLAHFDLLASLIEVGGQVCHEVTTAGSGSMCGVHKHRWPCPTVWQVSRAELVRALRQLRVEYLEAMSGTVVCPVCGVDVEATGRHRDDCFAPEYGIGPECPVEGCTVSIPHYHREDADWGEIAVPLPVAEPRKPSAHSASGPTEQTS